MNRDRKEKQKYMTRNGRVVKQNCFNSVSQLGLCGEDFMIFMASIEDQSEDFTKDVAVLVDPNGVRLNVLTYEDVNNYWVSNGIHIVYKDKNDKPVKILRIGFPLLFAQEINNHWVYNITLHSDSVSIDESFTPICVSGYVGMTSRHPLVRVEEHRRDMMIGKGHSLHSAWRALYAVDNSVCPYIVLLSSCETRAKAFDAEECFVDTLFGVGTLIPQGLNVIRGGMAGVRELWRLGLCAERATGDERDAALERLERHPAHPHYVRGHIRNIDNWRDWKMGVPLGTRPVWVKPHWRNLIAEKVI